LGELSVFTAGVAYLAAQKAIEKWNALADMGQMGQGLAATLTKGGSVIGVNKLLEGAPFDVLILADEELAAKAIFPKLAFGYAVFAGNKMVVAANSGRSIDSSNWLEKLTAPGAVFAHYDPLADPGGYRAVMAMTLADRYKKGLASALLNSPGRLVLGPPDPLGKGPDYDYIFGYYSMAKSRGLVFAELPRIMDLSDDSLAEVYRTAEVELSGGLVVKGSPIAHALVVPKSAPNPDKALEFARLFLATDFLAYNFSPRAKVVGSLWEPRQTAKAG
jgi:molybdate/tungstate transport system substrate-binding protein